MQLIPALSPAGRKDLARVASLDLTLGAVERLYALGGGCSLPDWMEPLLESRMAREPEATLIWARLQPAEVARAGERIFFRAHAPLRPAEAVAYRLAHPDELNALGSLREALAALARLDLPAALAGIDALSAAEQPAARAQALAILAADQPRVSLDVARRWGLAPGQALAAWPWRAWMHYDPAATQAAIRSLPRAAQSSISSIPAQ